MSGPVGVDGFEKTEFNGDSTPEKVASRNQPEAAVCCDERMTALTISGMFPNQSSGQRVARCVDVGVEAVERRRRRLDDAAHDVGGQEPGRSADSGADGEQSAALSDRRGFAPDRKPFQTPSS